MRNVKLSDIRVGKEYRKDLGNLQDLASSIKEIGLLHPLVVRSDTMELVAGRRRLEALKLLGYEEVPEDWVRFVDIKRTAYAVLHENTLRKDLTDYEKVLVLEEIDRELRELEAQQQTAAEQPLEQEVLDAGAEEMDEEGEDLSEEADLRTEVKREPQSDSGRSVLLDAKSRHLLEGVAKNLGWSYETARKAYTVYTEAKRDPNKYGELLEEMKSARSIKVEPLWQKFHAIRTAPKPKAADSYPLSGAVIDLIADPSFKLSDSVVRLFRLMPPELQEEVVKKLKAEGVLYYVTDEDVKDALGGRPLESLTAEEAARILKEVARIGLERTSQIRTLKNLNALASMIRDVIVAEHGPFDLHDRMWFAIVGMCMFVDAFALVLRKYVRLLNASDGRDAAARYASFIRAAAEAVHHLAGLVKALYESRSHALAYKQLKQHANRSLPEEYESALSAVDEHVGEIFYMAEQLKEIVEEIEEATRNVCA
ncbi:MAG: ParB/RepB/Spo0J family partition protein [Thermofilum sp.]